MKTKLIAMLLSAALLTSCAAPSDTPEESDGTASSVSTTSGEAASTTFDEGGSGIIVDGVEITDALQAEVRARNFPSYEEVQMEYPDKTVLVFPFEGTMYDSIKNIRTREANEYLAEQGYDFVVCLEPESTMMADDRYAYVDYIKEKEAAGKQVDIVFGYSRFLTARRVEGIYPFNMSVYEGIAEPLDGYLETDTGKALYDLMPESFWDSHRINGSIYGISGDLTELSYDFGYYVNAQLAEKYGFDTHKPITEQLDLLQKVKNEEQSTDAAVIIDTALMPDIDDFGSVMSVTDGVYLENGEFHSAMESEAYVENIRLLNTLATSGLLKYTNVEESHRENAFIIFDNICAGGSIYDGVETVSIDYYGTETEVVPVFKNGPVLTTCGSAISICSFSQHKEEAFEFLVALFTDPYLNNLLAYGLEGEDYTLENGHVVPDLEHGNPHSDRFQNKLICYPGQRDPDNAAEAYRAAFEAAESADLSFSFDGRAVEDEIIAVTDVMQTVSVRLLLAEDFDAAVEEMQKALEEAGIDVIMRECEAQYEAWKSSRQ